MTLNRELRRVAAHYHRQGFDVQESVKLAADHINPYPKGLAYWAKNNSYDGNGDYPLARHYVPHLVPNHLTENWRGGGRNSH